MSALPDTFREKIRSLSRPQQLLAAAVAVVLLVALVFAAASQSPSARLSRQLELGSRYLTDLDYETAVLHFTKAIEIDARSEPAYLGRAEAYLGLEEYQLAVDDYTVVIDTLNPESADAYTGRAKAYTGLGDQEHAAADEARAAELNGTAGQTDTTTAAPSRAPLTAADLQWTLEPTYNYTQVMPLRGKKFSDMQGPYSNGTEPVVPGSTFYEMSFPSYSNLPEYYAVRVSEDTWKCYYLPGHTDSGDIRLNTPGSKLFSTDGLRYDAYGIVNYSQMDSLGYVPNNGSPWYVFNILERGSGSMDVYYDSYLQQSLVIGSFYGLYSAPVAACDLHKPYPCQQISTQDVGADFSQVLSLDFGGDDQDSLTNISNLIYEREQNALSTPYAYTGTDGQLITDFSYDMAEDFSEGLAACRKDGKWGYIDENGQPVTDFVYDGVWYNSGYDPDIGTAGAFTEKESTGFPCTSDTMVVCQDGQYGLLYRDGTLLIGFGELEAMAPAYNNELWAKQNGLWGLVDLADVKQKAGVDPTLSVTAPTAVPDPPVDNVSMVASFQTGDVPIDYPTVVSERSQIPTGTSTTTADSGLVMRTGPGTDYPRKGSIPVGSDVSVWGALRSTPGWVYISWYDRQTMQTVYGWVSQEYLQSGTPPRQ